MGRWTPPLCLRGGSGGGTTPPWVGKTARRLTLPAPSCGRDPPWAPPRGQQRGSPSWPASPRRPWWSACATPPRPKGRREKKQEKKKHRARVVSTISPTATPREVPRAGLNPRAPVVVVPLTHPLLRSPPLATRPARLVQQPATLLLAATTRLIPPFTVTPRASIFSSSVVRARTLAPGSGKLDAAPRDLRLARMKKICIFGGAR